MAEEKQGAAANELPKKGFNLELIYLKDASFETPNSPAIFATEWENPTINIAMSHNNEQISDNAHEVIQTITVTANLDDTVAYLAEVQQAGIFTLIGIKPDDMQQLFDINCLSFLYPYTREAISNLINKGGFPNIALTPVNFRALYEKKRDMKNKEPDTAEASD